MSDQPTTPDVSPEMLMQMAVTQAHHNLGFDIPRHWSTAVTLSEDATNGTVLLVFREGFNVPFDINGMQATQEIGRNVVSVALPKRVAVEFLEGAHKFFRDQGVVAE